MSLCISVLTPFLPLLYVFGDQHYYVGICICANSFPLPRSEGVEIDDRDTLLIDPSIPGSGKLLPFSRGLIQITRIAPSQISSHDPSRNLNCVHAEGAIT